MQVISQQTSWRSFERSAAGVGGKSIGYHTPPKQQGDLALKLFQWRLLCNESFQALLAEIHEFILLIHCDDRASPVDLPASIFNQGTAYSLS